MNSTKSLLIAFTALFSVAFAFELEGQSPAIRRPKNRYEQDANRNLAYVCNVAEGLFANYNGGVDCTCTNNFLSGEIGFDCTTRDFACKELPLTGKYCSKTNISGKLNFFFFQLKSTIAVKGCEKSVWANNTVAGDVPVGDVCLNLAITGRILGPSGVSACGSTFGAITCNGCSTCKYDVPKTNRTGTSVTCSNLVAKPCFPFEVPAFVSGRESEQKSGEEFLAEFDPTIVQQPAMAYAMSVVEEKIAEMNVRW